VSETKKQIQFLSIFIFFWTFLLQVHADDSIHYTVKKGDYLAKILRENGYDPIFGTNAALEKTMAINQGKIRDFNQLEPGDVIQLPEKKRTRTRTQSSPNQNQLPVAHKVWIQCPNGKRIQSDAVFSPGANGSLELVLKDDQFADCGGKRTPAFEHGSILREGIYSEDLRLPSISKSETEGLSKNNSPELEKIDVSKIESGKIESGNVESLKVEGEISSEPMVKLKEIKWQISFGPRLGYGSHKFFVSSDYFTMNKGLSGGARLEFSREWKNWGALLGLSYEVGSFPNVAQSTDKNTIKMTQYGLGFRYRIFAFRFGANSNVVDNSYSNIGNSFSDTGMWQSLSLQTRFKKVWRFGFETRFAQVKYRMSANSSTLRNDVSGTQIESFLNLEYLWGF
jgi:LysM domain